MQVLSSREKSLPKRHARTTPSPTQWVPIDSADAEFESNVSSRTLKTSSETSNPSLQESRRYRLQRSLKAGSVSAGSQIVWSHENNTKSTTYRLTAKEPGVIKRQEKTIAGAELYRRVLENLLATILAVLILYLICNPALNYMCKDPNQSGLCHDDRYPRPQLTKLFDDHFSQNINTVNQKFAEIQSRNKDIGDFYFSLSKSTSAVRELRTSVQYSNIAPRERVLLGLDQYIANTRINGKLQGVLRAFVASISNNKERVEFYTKTVFEAVGHLKEPLSLDSNYPALWIMICWPFWLPLDHFREHSDSPLYLAASHFDGFVASTKPRSDKTLRLARNLESTLLEQIGHLDSLFTNADIINTTARTGKIIVTEKASKKAKPGKLEVAIVSRPSRRLSRLWVQTGGEEQDSVSEALDWTDSVLPQVVDTIDGTIQSLEEITVLLYEIRNYANNLRDVG